MVREQFRRGVLPASVAFLLFTWTPWAAAQPQPAQQRPNSVYVEWGGSGYWLTLNYERMLSSKINVRVGGGAIPGDLQPAGYELTIGGPDLGSVPVIVVGSNVVFGKRRHQFTAGVAVHAEWNRVKAFEPSEAVYFGGELGYRYHSSSGFLLKATVALMAGKETAWLLPGVSLGWSF